MNKQSETNAGADSGSIQHTVVEFLPDLIGPAEYRDHQDGRLVRIRISVTSDGVEVLGDAFRPHMLEELLEQMGPDAIEQMLCG